MPRAAGGGGDEGSGDDSQGEEEGDGEPVLQQQVLPAARQEQPPVQPALQGGERQQGREVRGAVEGEEELEPWLRPQIPQPDPGAGREQDTDGWSAIGRVGAWGAMLSEHRVLEEIPEQHKPTWAWGVAQILRKLHTANTEEEINQALMWFCFLPQALLRKNPRGGKAGRGQTARRFNTLAQGDWGGLVEIWEKDREWRRRGRGGRGLEPVRGSRQQN